MPVSGSLTHKGNCSGTQKTEPDPPTADKPAHAIPYRQKTTGYSLPDSRIF